MAKTAHDDLTNLRTTASKIILAGVWLHLPIVVLLGHAYGNLLPQILCVALLCSVATAAWRTDRTGPATRTIVGLSLTAANAVIIDTLLGTPLQSHLDNYAYIGLAILALYCDTKLLLLGAVYTVLNQLAVNLAIPDEQGFGARDAAIHGFLVIIEIGLLAWLVGKAAALFERGAKTIKDLEHALRQNAELLTALETTPNGNAIVIRQPNGYRITHANPALIRMLAADPVGGTLTDLFQEDLAPLLTPDQPLNNCLEARLAGDGRWTEVSVARVPDTDEEKTLVISITDISRRKADEEFLRRAAFTDSLTGLPNRAAFAEKLNAPSPSGYRAVLFIDLDRFKIVNDSLGHLVGDSLLKALGQRLSTAADGMFLARLGGDEFALVTDAEDAKSRASRVAASIHQLLEQPFNVDGHELYSSASIGMASANDRSSGDSILRDADAAMYDAKASGRGATAPFTPIMHTKAVGLLRIENEMRKAIDANLFIPHYQPIVDTAHGQLVGFEALARWPASTGAISPADFIPVAEDTGLITEIGISILRRGLADLARWHSLSGSEMLRLSVNVAPRQLTDPGFPYRVSEALAESGVSPSHLKLEITESAICGDPMVVLRNLQGLKSIGLKLDIDDFGTGHSSLSHLHRFPLDGLKIDASFVQRLGESDSAIAIVKAIIALGGSLGLKVTAEGVERIEQANLLRTLGCDLLQGYLYSRPLPPHHADELVAQGVQFILQRDAS